MNVHRWKTNKCNYAARNYVYPFMLQILLACA